LARSETKSYLPSRHCVSRHKVKAIIPDAMFDFIGSPTWHLRFGFCNYRFSFFVIILGTERNFQMETSLQIHIPWSQDVYYDGEGNFCAINHKVHVETCLTIHRTLHPPRTSSLYVNVINVISFTSSGVIFLLILTSTKGIWCGVRNVTANYSSFLLALSLEACVFSRPNLLRPM
jgi:hypothetical protein